MPLVVGAQVGLGFEWAARNSDLRDAMDGADTKNSIGFSGGGWLYANYYFSGMLAVQGGLGFVAKGLHFKTEQNGEELHVWSKFSYMEFPLGVKINVVNIRITALMLLDIALTGKTKLKMDDVTTEEKWEDADWDNFRRFNLGLRLGVGYAIPVGPIVLVPAMNWSTQFIDLYKDDIPEQMRFMNFFFNVSVEYGIPL
jgi:hypothetical protein